MSVLANIDAQSGIDTLGSVLFKRGKVSFQGIIGNELIYMVRDGDEQRVRFFSNKSADCTCGAGALCPHISAAWLKAGVNGQYASFMKESALRLGEKMKHELTLTAPGGEGIRLAIGIRLMEDGRLALGLSIGQDRMYAVKNIQDFMTCYVVGIPLTLSDKFTYDPSIMRFPREDERFISMLFHHVALKESLVQENKKSVSDYFTLEASGIPDVSYEGRYMILSGPLMYSTLRYLENHEFILIVDGEKSRHASIRTVELPLCFMVSTTATELQISCDGAEFLRMLTPDGRYVLWRGQPVHLHGKQARVCRLLCVNGSTFIYPARDMEKTLDVLLPSLSNLGTVIPSAELNARLLTEKLVAAVYVDLEGNKVVARVEFRYGDILINPFLSAENVQDADTATVTLKDNKVLLRDGRSESLILSMLSEGGFSVRSGRVVLRRSKDILHFCTQGVSDLAKYCEVYASDAFQKIKPRRLKARIGFKMRGGHLVMELLENNGEQLEVLPVLKAIAQRQEYVRLKTGEFLDIRDMSGLSSVTQEVLEAARLDDEQNNDEAKEINFSAYRAVYMVNMLRAAGAKTDATGEVDEVLASISDGQKKADQYLTEKLNKTMTDYQHRGINWLFTLYDANMGGVLADEMGLGKTAQVIATLSAAKARDGVQKSIIVTPSSLTYHWLAEFKRFDDNLVVRVVTGHREDRRNAIEEIRQDENVDVILTSYPLLRRDIDFLADMEFRFAILDEAQSVKNAQSIGAEAAKRLKAKIHIALTGTPMENHTGELWSIFDFVLPGYLGSQPSFLHRYGDGEKTEELQERIRPFLLRRLKMDVLKNLPQKRETQLYCAMTEEQATVYNGLLQTLREHVGDALKEGSLPRARMQVLSLLLKLRQVCCHPKLLLSDYNGTSGKLELLVNTVQNALEDKHRLLIFSQFVGMLQLIRQRLARQGITSLYLDGDTKPETRQELCDRFNGGEGSVFLISLKAGGTGLNLTGADLVIHYDPWWNPAAEDQATDRAHRIGQRRDVDVIRMIAQDTIEEKVVQLSQKKRSIFDMVVMAGETGLADLTEEEIRALFF